MPDKVLSGTITLIFLVCIEDDTECGLLDEDIFILVENDNFFKCNNCHLSLFILIFFCLYKTIQLTVCQTKMSVMVKHTHSVVSSKLVMMLDRY